MPAHHIGGHAIDYFLHRAGMLQPGPHGQHAKQHAHQAAIDKPKRLVRVDTAGQQNHGDPDKGHDFDRGNVDGGQADDADQHGDNNRGLAAAKGPFFGMGDVNQVHVGGQTLNILHRALQQQCIANAHHQIIQLAANVLIAAVGGQHINRIATAQAQFAQTAAHHLAIGGNQHLDRAGLHR